MGSKGQVSKKQTCHSQKEKIEIEIHTWQQSFQSKNVTKKHLWSLTPVSSVPLHLTND